MTISDVIESGGLKVDFDSEILYSHDQAYNTYPVVFPTVNFTLVSSDNLISLAGEILSANGDSIGSDDAEFTIGINGYTKTKVDNCIVFTISDYDGEIYQIPLSDEEQTKVWDILNGQCKDKLKKSCDELLEEARKELN